MIILSVILGGWAAWLFRRPPLVLSPTPPAIVETPVVQDSIISATSDDSIHAPLPDPPARSDHSAQSASSDLSDSSDPSDKSMPVKVTDFKDVALMTLGTNNPFRDEARKLLNGRLEETDSVSRHKILSYCEHLRTSYTTRDIDFLRQVFSDKALIIVGHVIKTGQSADGLFNDSQRVKYVIRTKQAYLEKLNDIFRSGKNIDVDFSDFKIMRHPTVNGIYGVTLRQKYTCGDYSDDGYLFLLWDFRDMSMPRIHVRTWQPTRTIHLGDDELIDISDFNLE